jgi:heptosyltransferase-2
VTEKKETILIVGPAWVGDMVMAQSLFKVLKQRNPAVQIDVLAPAWTEPLLARMPEVHDAIPVALGHGQLELTSRWKLGRSLRNRIYDHAIILPRSLKSAIIPFAAKARRRTGFLGEQRWFLLNDIRKLDKKALPRTVDRFVALGLDKDQPLPDSLPQPSLTTHPASAHKVLEKIGHKMTETNILGICPGAEYGPAKRWPAAYYADVANKKLDEGWEVWLFGSENDQPIAEEIMRLTGQGCLDLSGKTSLVEAVDLLGLCSTVLTNDSGLMHVAAATGVPIIAIYGSSDPGHTPPLTDNAKIMYLALDCSPCFKRECPLGHTECLKNIPPELVANAIHYRPQEQLNES